MTIKKILLVLSLGFNTIFGHAIWIETNTAGKSGQAHEVKVFLGEYANKERDSTQNWFSNMREFTLWLISPDGKKSPLSCIPNGNHFKATFTPSAAGTYALSIDHTVTEVYGGSKVHYYALGLVSVDSVPLSINGLHENADFLILTNATAKHKINTPEKVQLLYQKKAPKEGSVAVQSPEGWAKTFKAEQNGEVSFIPMWSGLYLLEGTFTEDASGQHEGQEYKRIWHCVTYCLNISQ